MRRASCVVRGLIKIGKKAVEEKFVVASGGNISARRGGFVFIKTSGPGLGSPDKKDYAKVNLKTGKPVNPPSASPRGEHTRQPSSELPFHIACYKARSDIGAVIHLHPVFSTAVANSAVKPGAISYELLACLGSELLKAKPKPAGSFALAKEVARLIKKTNAILLPNHGLITVGKTIDAAFTRALAVERACQTLIFSRLLGLHKFLPRKEAKRIISLYRGKVGSRVK
jgi:L-fuculose-phosphate aldolase